MTIQDCTVQTTPIAPITRASDGDALRDDRRVGVRARGYPRSRGCRHSVKAAGYRAHPVLCGSVFGVSVADRALAVGLVGYAHGSDTDAHDSYVHPATVTPACEVLFVAADIPLEG